VIGFVGDIKERILRNNIIAIFMCNVIMFSVFCYSFFSPYWFKLYENSEHGPSLVDNEIWIGLLRITTFDKIDKTSTHSSINYFVNDTCN